jgi:histidinol-phosphate/aromatic aminotransferase/cobyric acid decarboxylase-like protein
MVFLANPNNPTGTWLDEHEVEGLLEAIPGDVIVVLDEAYHEYSAPLGVPDGTRWLARHPNLVVTRTFSKAYGLAGLRIGYALSHPDIGDLLNRVRQPFNVSVPWSRGGGGGPRRSRSPRCDARAQSRRAREPARRPSEARHCRTGIRR